MCLPQATWRTVSRVPSIDATPGCPLPAVAIGPVGTHTPAESRAKNPPKFPLLMRIGGINRSGLHDNPACSLLNRHAGTPDLPSLIEDGLFRYTRVNSTVLAKPFRRPSWHLS